MNCPRCSKPLTTVVTDVYRHNHKEEVEIRCLTCNLDWTEFAIDQTIELEITHYKENRNENI